LHSTPHSSDEPATTSSGGRTGYWRSETLPGGTERHWSDLARDYTENDAYRAGIAEAIDAVTWHRHGTKIAFSPGALLNELASQIESRPMAAGTSDVPVELPESDLSDHEQRLLEQDPGLLHPDRFQTTSVVALAFREGRTVFLMYYLDEGVRARPVALDIRDLNDTGPGISANCAARLHTACRGRYITEDRETRPCQCGCGCVKPEPVLQRD
jgi:hypothetical protein